ncbi:MAG: hypothetical protein LBQ61_08745 [Spirochaetales bacterium]|jgi:hypothetical protein|nr:hypothetical protein [Spirochaetales bacterium]
MKKGILLGLWLSLVPVVLSGAYQWPVQRVVLKQTFGQDDQGVFLPGLTLSGPPQEVRPVEGGELIYYFGEDQPYLLPSGLGNFAVLRHERNLLSLYAHLESPPPDRPDPYFSPAEVLGVLGSSELGLQIIDMEFNQTVNPLKILPPLADRIPPEVGEVFIRAGEEWRPLVAEQGLPWGDYELAAEIWDQSPDYPDHQPMAPYQVRVFINGRESFSQTFEGLEAEGGRLFLGSRRSRRRFEELYTSGGDFFLGRLQLSRGLTVLEIIAEDFQGNRSFKSLSLFGLSGEGTP